MTNDQYLKFKVIDTLDYVERCRQAKSIYDEHIAEFRKKRSSLGDTVLEEFIVNECLLINEALCQLSSGNITHLLQEPCIEPILLHYPHNLP